MAKELLENLKLCERCNEGVACYFTSVGHICFACYCEFVKTLTSEKS